MSYFNLDLGYTLTPEQIETCGAIRAESIMDLHENGVKLQVVFEDHMGL